MKTAEKVSSQKGLSWAYSLLILPVALGVGAWQGWTWWSWASAPPLTSQAVSPNEARAVRIQIPEGTPTQVIGQDLESAGLIRSAFAWNLWSRWLSFRNPQGGFKAGTYELSPAYPLQTTAAKIWAGEGVQSTFTIPEGWSLQQMASYFEAQGFFKAEDFRKAVTQIPQSQFPWLPANLPHLEGFLYPDTYQVDGDRATPEAVIQVMLKRFEEVALPVYQRQAGKTKFSLLEWVTLSSIIEKEAVIPAERTRISGVLVQRLKRGMLLGVDPTVEYGLGIRQTQDQPLTLNQVNTPSPYNTYLNPGLPPTPIASPGLASLEAALAPEDTPYLYFVARYDGTHVFSRTLQEHEAAQAAIQDQQAARRTAAKTGKPGGQSSP